MGHYCRMCGRTKPNESFSGKGHRQHICKTCRKRPREELERIERLGEIEGLFRQSHISDKNVSRLQTLSESSDGEVRELAKLVLEVALVHPRKRGRYRFLVRDRRDLLRKLAREGLVDHIEPIPDDPDWEKEHPILPPGEPYGPDLRDLPFKRLIEENAQLKQLRREYALKSEQERRMAALFQYEASYAGQLFGKALGLVPGAEDCPLPEDDPTCPGEVAALAIDPKCAPALLTVGSVEYQLGRRAEAMELFLTLTTLPAETEDLQEIIEQAAYFLADQQDFGSARELFQAAADRFPSVGGYYNGLGYCAGKMGEGSLAVEYSRKAIELAPKDHRFLNDLGYSLMQIRRYEEAEEVLTQAVVLSPRSDKLAQNNLKYLHQLMNRPAKRSKPRKGVR